MFSNFLTQAFLIMLISSFIPRSFQSKSRLFNLVPIGNQLDDFLRDLNNNTEAKSVLLQIQKDNLQNLIKIRERSMELSLKPLVALSLTILAEEFSIKNLDLKSITWQEASPEVVDFVAKNDRVRLFEDLEVELLKKRLEGQTFRCYGLFHERIQNPISFVYIKLHQYKQLPSSLDEVYDYPMDSFSPKSCIFYSISSPVRGLNGIEFGAKLIKNVVNTIRIEQPQITTFATFSPIPQFRQWLRANPLEYEHLTELTVDKLDDFKSELMEVCEKYLVSRNDSVTRFHFRNGAKLGPIHFRADLSLQSFKQSYGIQVNYIYYK